MTAQPRSGATLHHAGPSTAHLHQRLTIVEARVRHLIAVRRADDPNPDDPFLGLYLPDHHVDRLLASDPSVTPAFPHDVAHAAQAIAAAAQERVNGGAQLRLLLLAQRFALDDLDVELLLVALAPDLDPRFERFYGYLNDDVSRRRATVGLALQLCGAAPMTAHPRARLTPDGPLTRARLLSLDDPDAPFLTRLLRVPDRITAYLLGDDRPDPLVRPVLAASPPQVTPPPDLMAAVERGVSLCYLEDTTGSAGTAAAAAALHRLGLPTVLLDLERLDVAGQADDVLAGAVREARLCGAGLVAGPVEALTTRAPRLVRTLADAPCPVVLTGHAPWTPEWSDTVPLTLRAPMLDQGERARLWARTLGPHIEATTATASFRLTPSQIIRASEAARLLAEVEGRAVEARDLQAGARLQNAAGLGRLARRVVPMAEWRDLVVPSDVAEQLHELCARLRHRDLVLDSWGVGRKASRGRGVTALFAGDSGTGKTLSAEVVAGELGLDLYVIDLSTVVDKYVGETEKNLDRLFAEADRVNGVLLFDEADALFGKRSEVSDAHDRYANVEVSYLLQRMEQFEGVAILTTNLRSNVDSAFTRRLDAIVDFPRPEAEDRRRLWDVHLRPPLRLDEDVDRDYLATSFTLSGGEIRNVAVAAAYLAAGRNDAVAMSDLVRATAREYRKLGRLVTPSEFGRYEHLLG